MLETSKLNMKGQVWDDPHKEDSRGPCIGIIKDDPKTRFVGALSNLITTKLRVNWNERNLVTNLLQSSFEEEVNDLLEQFENCVLEEVGEHVSQALDVKKVVDYDHATHAKFATMLKETGLKYPCDCANMKPQVSEQSK